MNLDKNNMKKIALLITFAIALYWLINNPVVFLGVLSYLVNLVSPFLVGAAIAFVLNAPLRSIEKKIRALSEKKGFGFLKKCYRVVSILLTFVLVIAVIVLVFFLIIPELGRTALTFAGTVQPAMDKLQRQLLKLAQDYPDLEQQIRSIDINWATIGQKMVSFLSVGAGSLVKSTVSVATTVVSVVTNGLISIIFAVYVLAQKENLSRQAKKMLYAVCKKERADAILQIMRFTNRTFTSFITGQFLEACILGAMFFVSMSILGFPYAMVISLVIIVSALIPIVGAFIGCVFGVILIVMVNPVKALWFIVLFLVLQQIEGNVIYPRVVGNSVGLPALWVLVAITVGGNMMGVLGMILFIPICSVIYALLREIVNRRIEEKKVKIDEV